MKDYETFEGVVTHKVHFNKDKILPVFKVESDKESLAFYMEEGIGLIEREKKIKVYYDPDSFIRCPLSDKCYEAHSFVILEKNIDNEKRPGLLKKLGTWAGDCMETSGPW